MPKAPSQSPARKARSPTLGASRTKFNDAEERVDYPGISPLRELTWITAPGADAVADVPPSASAHKGAGKGKKGKPGKGKGKGKSAKGKKGSKNSSKDAANGRGGRTVSLG